MILSDISIKRLILEKGLITNYVNLEMQLQPCGFDLTLEEVRVFPQFGAAACLDFSNERRLIPDYERFHRLEFKSKDSDLQTGSYTYLAGHSHFVFQCAEYFRMPDNIVAAIMPRSSLTRSGITLVSPIVDPGYEGKLRFLVSTVCPSFIEEKARFAQAIFMKLDMVCGNPYKGMFKGQR